MKVKSRNVQFTVSFETVFPALCTFHRVFPIFHFLWRTLFYQIEGLFTRYTCLAKPREDRGSPKSNPTRLGWEPDGCPWVPQIYILFCRLLFLSLFCYFPSFFLFVILFVFFLFWWQRWITKYNTGETGAFIRKDIHLTWSKRIACFFNPLNPDIKIQILICYPYTFSKEAVGRICWIIN